MAGYPCCCGASTGCIVCEDDFNRTAGTDITTGSACGWTEVAGDWTITSSGTLKTTATGAFAEVVTVNPAGEVSVANVLIKFVALNDIAQIHLNVGDITDSHYVEIIPILEPVPPTLGQWRIKLFKTGTLLDEAVIDATGEVLGQFIEFRICFKSGFVRAGLSPDATAVVSTDAVPASPADKAALGTGATNVGGIEFDDFAFLKHTNECERCGGLCFNCSPIASSPDQFQLVVPAGTFTEDAFESCSTPGQCDQFEGTFILNRFGSAVCVWRFDFGSTCFDQGLQSTKWILDIAVGCSVAGGVGVRVFLLEDTGIFPLCSEVSFFKTETFPRDCINYFVNYDVPWDYNSGQGPPCACDENPACRGGAGKKVTITAL